MKQSKIIGSFKNSLGKAMFALIIAVSVFAQSPAPLQISSPANSSIVNSGQTLNVTVTSPAGLAFQMLAVIGPDPIGFNTLASSAPAQFSIAIPADADCGLYTLTADGLTQSGQHITSAPIQIDVERADVPMQISASDSGLVLESLGEQVHLVVFASFSDGSTINVTGSSLVSYGSSNSSVAAVDASGTVTAAGPGSASITASYAISGQSRAVSIPVNVSPLSSSVTITGVNFGASQGTSTVTFNGTTATPTSWSATSIVAPVPSGATSGNVVVTVGE